MHKTSFLEKPVISLLTLSLMLLISSCQLGSDEKQNLKNKVVEQANKAVASDPEPEEENTNDFFSPSHTTNLDLIKREDGDFDTPVEIKYQDLNGKVWTAPAGTITDGASIPSYFTKLFGGKMNKKHLFAAIVHDAYCGIANNGKSSYQVESWQNTHHMFYHACRKNGTDETRAGTMYAAVRLGGPRWSSDGKPVKDLSAVDKDDLMKAMQDCIKWIAAKKGTATLEEIDNWMDKLEADLLKNI